MRIAMMGSGGIGGYFGGRMAAAGADVTFIARGRHLDAIRNTGLKIDSAELGDTVIHPAQATDNPADVGPVDCVIMGVKLWDTAETGHAIAPMLGPDTTVLSLQNGVDGDDILAPIVGHERLIGGVAFIASSISEPGTIKHVGTIQRIVMGEPDGSESDRVVKLQAAMIAGGIDVEISDDVERTIWEKFVFLVGMSSTTTLMNSEIGPIRNDPGGPGVPAERISRSHCRRPRPRRRPAGRFRRYPPRLRRRCPGRNDHFHASRSEGRKPAGTALAGRRGGAHGPGGGRPDAGVPGGVCGVAAEGQRPRLKAIPAP